MTYLVKNPEPGGRFQAQDGWRLIEGDSGSGALRTLPAGQRHWHNPLLSRTLQSKFLAANCAQPKPLLVSEDRHRLNGGGPEGKDFSFRPILEAGVAGGISTIRNHTVALKLACVLLRPMGLLFN